MANEEPTTPDEPKKGSIVVKAGIGGAILATILAECGLVYFFLPSAADVQAAAEQKIAEEDAVESEKMEVDEVDLGTFSISLTPPNATATLRIDFHLFGTVGSADQSELETLHAERIHRFRDIVITEILMSDRDDLVNSRLGLIKRRILEKSNSLLGKPLLKSVLLSNYSFVDQ